MGDFIPKKNWILKAKNTTLVMIAAEFLECDKRQVYRYMMRGQIRWVWVGGEHPARGKLLYLPDVMKLKRKRKEKS